MASLSSREELIRIQKRLFRKNQRIIEESILFNEKDFLRYEQNYLRYVRQFERPAEARELKSALEAAQWVYMGDYHTNMQSQRSFLRVLKLLITRTDQFIIALEFIRKKHQSSVHKFLNGKIKFNRFLENINIRRHYYFDLWENFEPIFDFAKFYQIDIYGIESAPVASGLEKRDQAMAQNLAELYKKNSDLKIISFVGDLHIAPPNLPKQVRHEVGKSYDTKKELFIYQNSEKIYWLLAQDELEHKVDIVKLNNKSFCLMNTPPIVWQQSYLNWLEQEAGEMDYTDPKHSFLEIVDRIANFLKLKLPREKNQVEVFTSGDLSFLERLKEDPEITVSERRLIKRQVEQAKSHYITQHRWVYLANVSLNHAAEEAGNFIRHLMVEEEPPRFSEDAFYAQVLQEALAFFSSKVINHKRKCLRLKDYRAMLAYHKKSGAAQERSLEIEIAHGVVELKKREKRGQGIADASALRRRHLLFFGMSRALGNILGEMIYHALIQGKMRRKKVRELLSDAWEEPGRPFSVYYGLLKKYEGVSLPNRL